MSEILGALGENDEPDPGSSSGDEEKGEDTKVRRPLVGPWGGLGPWLQPCAVPAV